MGFFIMILSYVFGALGMYTIAKRRGIHHAWAAWVPFFNVWMLGCISDQYRSVEKGQDTNRRKSLLVLSILLVVLVIVLLVFCVQLVLEIIPPEFWLGEKTDAQLEELLFNSLTKVVGKAAGIALVSLAMSGIGIALAVVQYVALYDLFYSCEPNTSVAFLLLSIFLGIGPFLIFYCRGVDNGISL